MKKFFILITFLAIIFLLYASIFNNTFIKNSKVKINNFYSKLQNKQRPKISVIIPCYNSERFLKNLFLMIDNQTFSDYEVIFVNDGSTDKTKNSIIEYTKKNKRAKLISYKQNKKAGHARNTGLKKAKGEYVIFLDSDDLYSPDLLKETYNIAKATNVDIVLFKTNCLDDRTQEIDENDIFWLWNPPYPENQIFTQDDVKDTLFSFCRGAVWNKLYKKEFLDKHNFYFLDLEIHNDSFFIYTTYVRAESMYISDKVLYTYRINRESSTYNKNFSLDKICEEISNKELEKYLIKNNLYEKHKIALKNMELY